MKRKEKKENGVKFPRRDELGTERTFPPSLGTKSKREREEKRKTEKKRKRRRVEGRREKENVDGKVRGLKEDREKERLARKDFSKDP
ncbi:hypothetical protein K0M31_017954 [Melipona bicolor]|uniref:Uncharacterized protein n=1 Tax=Melipona bicolor TaxID=60889 RepID=A0AA40G6A2_9HYME|nr:hypothetical protein K0M31_017954 [Melipona bicolor]